MADLNHKIVHLSFTIGPVQAFVAQARRTRDLWAGSWLLSYLAESALVAAEKSGGTAIIPHRDKSGIVTSKQSAIGGIPNRFELLFESGDAKQRAKEAAEAAEAGFRKAWQRVANAVFDRYVQPVKDAGNDTATIWQGQVASFWELSWVLGEPNPSGTIAHLAAARKNIRDVRAQPEQGVKCSLMGTLQEISGHFGNGGRSKQEAFWEKLRQRAQGLDIKDGERLGAIALIKRLFPHVMGQAVDGDIQGTLSQQESWPSTAFFAALPWLKSVEQLAKAEAEAYTEAACQAGWQRSECQAANDSGLQTDWAKLDGPAWFAGAVLQDEPGKARLGPDPSKEDEATRKKEVVQPLLKKLKKLHETAANPPVPYYALLLMDGDSVGKLAATLGSPHKVSQGLAVFAETVKKVIEEHGGRAIYAGGDDVMALLPAKCALSAAQTLHAEYAKSFAHVALNRPILEATLSGAIVHAHWKFPLRQVLRTAHHLLDDIAKDQTGRDSLAIGIVQGGGLSAVWSAPWAVVRGETREGFGKLETVIDQFNIDSTNKETTEFNASYLYHLREQFTRLLPHHQEQPGQFQHVPFHETSREEGNTLLLDLAHAEYRRRMTKEDREKEPPEATRARLKPLIALSRQWTRCDKTAQVNESDQRTFSFDGWRVARFLKQVREGKVDSHE